MLHRAAGSQREMFPPGTCPCSRELLPSSPLVHKGLFVGEKKALQPAVVFCTAVNITVLHKLMSKTRVTARASSTELGTKGHWVGIYQREQSRFSCLSFHVWFLRSEVCSPFQ